MYLKENNDKIYCTPQIGFAVIPEGKPMAAMSENFKKLKRKYFLCAVLFSAALGVACGLFAVGAVYLALKLADAELHAGYYVLIGFGAACVAGIPLFLVFRPNDVACAKSLDRRFSLGEKVQTMVEFEGKEGPILGVQRQTTDDILGGLNVRWWTPVRIVACAVALVIAAGVFLTALLLPAKGKQNSSLSEPEPFEITAFQRGALNELIANTQACALTETVRTTAADTLISFRAALDDVGSQTELDSAVIAAVVIIDGAVAEANSYRTICTELAKYTETQPLSAYIQTGINFYNYATPTVGAYAYEAVAEHAAKLNAEIADRLDLRSSSLRATFSVEAADGNNDYYSKLQSTVSAFGLSLNQALSSAGAEDALSVALTDFYARLTSVVDGATGKTQDDLEAEIDDFFRSQGEKIAPPLSAQSYGCMMDEYIRKTLAAIFNVSERRLPSNAYSDGSDYGSGGDGDDIKDNTGGAGDGQTKYGSNDEIYDPDNEEYIVYGDKIAQYYAAALEELERSGMSDELAEKVNKYFQLLYGNTQT